MWTSHDAFFDQRCDTKCKDWKQDWSRHLYTHCLSALLFILYPVSQTSLVSPGLDHWLRWSQDCYRSKVCWWYFIPEIWRVENQSRWKKDSCFVAHRSLGCKWKQNKKVKRWRRCLEEGQISRINTRHWRRYQKTKRAINSYKKFESTFSSKHVSDKIKIRVFTTYTQSIFMYNLELWTLTRTLENSIDVFQRKLLRRIINVKWARTISNKDLYGQTEIKPWSITIKTKRVIWFGQLICLPAKIPV